MKGWAGVILLAASSVAFAGDPCLTDHPESDFAARLPHWNEPEEAMGLLESRARFEDLYESLHREFGDLQPDHLACVLAFAARPLLGEMSRLYSVIEGYRDASDPAFSSMVLMGLFRHASEAALAEIVPRYQARACRTPAMGRFDLRVAGDAIASMTDILRERFIQSILQLYGPGSPVHYKTEANDCLFLVDRTLAEAALGTLPEEKRRTYEPRLAAFHH